MHNLRKTCGLAVGNLMGYTQAPNAANKTRVQMTVLYPTLYYFFTQLMHRVNSYFPSVILRFSPLSTGPTITITKYI